MSPVQAVTAVTISGAFVVGMVLALLGSIKLALTRKLEVGETHIGGLLFALNLALIPMMLLAGYSLDRLGFRVVLIVGSLIVSGSLFILSTTPNYQRAFLALLLAGVGLAAVATATVVLMPLAFFDDQARFLTPALNLGHVFMALGALVTPILADFLQRTLGYRRTLIMLALLSLLPAFLCILPVFGTAVGETVMDQTDKTHFSWSRNEVLHLTIAGLVFLFYAPLEGALGIWATSLLMESGYSERRSYFLLSAFWTAFLSSRLLIAYLPLRSSAWDPWLLVIPSILAAAVLGNIAGSVGKAPARNGLLMAGFLLGPIFPTLISMIFHDYPLDRGMTYGFIYAIGSLGSLAFTPLLGLRNNTTGAHRAMGIAMALALLMGGMGLIFALIRFL